MRITEKDLDAVVNRINVLTDSPTESYLKNEDGKYKAQVGNFHIDHAYGGVALHRMSNVSGGVRDIFSYGHMPKRELYNRMQAFIDGLEFCHE